MNNHVCNGKTKILHQLKDMLRSIATAGVIATSALYAGCANPNAQDIPRFIGDAGMLSAKKFSQFSTNEKILYGKKSGVYLQGQQSQQTQQFDNGSLEGTINRVGGGVYNYFSELYVDAAVMSERRKFDFASETGDDIRFGNNARNAVGKIGYVKDGTFDSQSPFDPSLTKILLTFSQGAGDTTGDIDGKYRSNRWTLEGRQRMGEDWYMTGGIASKREHLGDDWTNTERSAEGGIGYDGMDFLGKHAFTELKGTYRSLESRMNDIEASSRHPGVRLSMGWQPSPRLELSSDIGHEDKDGLGTYGTFNVIIKLDGSSRK